MITTYGMYAQQFLTIDMDNDGLFCLVPGMSENWFKVRVDESGVCPVATHCKCSKFAHKGTCDHCEIVNAFYTKLYKTNIAKAEQSALEQAMDESDAVEEVYEMAALVDQISYLKGLEKSSTVTAQPATTPKLRKQGNKLIATKIDYQSKRTASFFAGLPSRRVA